MVDKFLIIVLNGPPRCGKDAITHRLLKATTPFSILNHKQIRGWHDRMISPLRDLVCALFKMSNYDFEIHKDDPILPNGVTPREAIIALDKRWSSYIFGEDFLGLLMIEELDRMRGRTKSFGVKEQTDIHFIDAGVEAELSVLRNAYGDKVKVIHIHKNGLDFLDSRTFLSDPDASIDNVEGQLDRAVEEILLLINKWLEETDDKLNAGITAGVLEAGA